MLLRLDLTVIIAFYYSLTAVVTHFYCSQSVTACLKLGRATIAFFQRSK